MLESGTGYFRKEPVEDQAAFNPALTVNDEDNLFDARILESFLNADVCLPHIFSVVCKVALDLERFRSVLCENDSESLLLTKH